MVKLQAKYYNSKTGEQKVSYKVGMMNPMGFGLTINDCIFGQFALEPSIRIVNCVKQGQPSTFESVKASIRWLNYDYSDPNMQPDNYGCFNLDMPHGLAATLRAQQWNGKFFMIYLEAFKGPLNDDRTRFKLVECDQNGQILPNQPQPLYNNPIPQNRTTTPTYYPGHAPQNNYVPQPPVQRPMQSNPVANPQAQGGFVPNAPRFNPGIPATPFQQNNAQNQAFVPQNNTQNQQMSAARQQAMQQNPVNPPQVQYGGVPMQNHVPQPIQPVATMPPLPNMNNQVPQVLPQSAMPQAPMTPAQGNTVPVQPQPQMQQTQSQSPQERYSKFGLTADEVEVLESLLNDAQLKDWKASANRDVNYFGEAIQVTANYKQKRIADNRLPVLWECWNTL